MESQTKVCATYMITTIFFDIGGVLLTDGWGHDSRREAALQFNLDWEDFSDRHEKVAHLIETNGLTLERYLDRVIFYRPRPFSRDVFREFVLAQSQPKPESLEIARQLAGLNKYFLATLNNEVLELNLYRIRHFDLSKCFSVFFSSCFLGLRKPDEAIYRAALNILQRAPEQCLFIDDREVNLECPRELGLRTIHFQDAGQLRRELGENGVEF
ncbi:MAG TPA: HAD family phosphatase [Pyrinomonadaceae bacterium]|nr:HAD family phosphatase [Pyrinomonadaceae bacterium]